MYQDTLFFSVPGITMPMEKMAQRAAASIATAGGMRVLQQTTLKEYEDVMVGLSRLDCEDQRNCRRAAPVALG